MHNEALHGLYSSPNIIHVLKSKEIKWGGGCYVWERSKVHRRFRLKNLKKRKGKKWNN